jgi:hypothetical protein
VEAFASANPSLPMLLKTSLLRPVKAGTVFAIGPDEASASLSPALAFHQRSFCTLHTFATQRLYSQKLEVANRVHT